jgi:uncharacterized protein (TIRG00374 family)
LRKKGYSVARSSVGVFVDRMQDMAFLVLFGCIGMLYFSGMLLGSTMVAAYLLLLLLAIAAVILLSKKIREGLLHWAVKYMLPRKFQGFFSRHLDRFLKDIAAIGCRPFTYTLLISLCLWIMTFATFYIAASILGISISFIFTAMVSSLATLVGIIPVSFSGLGTRDAVIILIFQQIGLSPEQAVAFSAVFLLVYVEFSLIGLVNWLGRPLDLGIK